MKPIFNINFSVPTDSYTSFLIMNRNKLCFTVPGWWWYAALSPSRDSASVKMSTFVAIFNSVHPVRLSTADTTKVCVFHTLNSKTLDSGGAAHYITCLCQPHKPAGWKWSDTRTRIRLLRPSGRTEEKSELEKRTQTRTHICASSDPISRFVSHSRPAATEASLAWQQLYDDGSLWKCSNECLCGRERMRYKADGWMLPFLFVSLMHF